VVSQKAVVNSTLEAPISPELCLVDPDLAARARLFLPRPSSRWLERPQQVAIAGGGSVGHSLFRVRSRTELWRLAVPMAALSALIGAGLALGASELLKTTRASESQSIATRPSESPAARVARSPVGSASSGLQHARAVSAPAKTKPHDARAKSTEAPAVAGRTAAAPARVASLVLRWKAVPGATRYDVILWQGHARVLDLWPTTTHVAVPTVWTYKGKVFHRTAGAKYLWFVYAVLGPKTALRYSSVINSGAF
jgi:hypothetical protein